MFRKPTDSSFNTIAVSLKWGGLGDNIARIPALRYLIKGYPQNSYHIFCPEYLLDLYKRFCLIENFGPRVHLHPYSEWKTAEKRFRIIIDFEPHSFTALRMHLVDVAFIHLNDKIPTKEESIYPKYDPFWTDVVDFKKWTSLQPSKYIVITTMYTAPVREWPAEEINKTVQGVIDRGYLPVFLGESNIPIMNTLSIQSYTSTEVDYSKGLDLRGETTLIEALTIMHNSHAVLGVDNGLLHLASCTKAPVIWGFTSVNPMVRLPETPYDVPHFIVSPTKLACKFCQTNINWEVNHDFTKCFYKDYLCLKEMKAEKFLMPLDTALEEK